MNIEKISVNGHYVWVDKDAEIKEGDWYLDDCNTARKSVILDTSYWSLRGGYFKIIAASHELKLGDVPTYVKWLAEQHQKGGYDWQKEKRDSFIKGYQAVEKELYTEEDVRKAIEMAREQKLTPYTDNEYEFTLSEEKIIEKLKQGGNK